MKRTRDQLVGLYPVRPTPADPSGTVDREVAMAMVGLSVSHVLRPLQRPWPETMKNLGAAVRALQEAQCTRSC